MTVVMTIISGERMVGMATTRLVIVVIDVVVIDVLVIDVLVIDVLVIDVLAIRVLAIRVDGSRLAFTSMVANVCVTGMPTATDNAVNQHRRCGQQ